MRSEEPHDSTDFLKLANDSPTRTRRFDPLMAFFIIIFVTMTALFYGTNFRQELENFFHDTRTVLMPPTAKSTTVNVVKITENSIRSLETDPIRLHNDAKNMPLLSVKNLTKASKILANTESRIIILLLPEYLAPASDPDMAELKDIIKFDHRFIIGTTGYHQTIPNLQRLPKIFAEVTDQIAAADTFRSRSNAIVRSLPNLSYLGLEETMNLPTKAANMVNPSFAPTGGKYIIKFNPPSHYPALGIDELLANPNRHMDFFKSKIVVLGYVVPRSSGIQTTEQLFTNTPVTGYAPTNLTGISSTWLMANAIENLAQNETISIAPHWITLIQTIIIGLVCGLSWQAGSLFAAILTLFTWAVLILAHAGLYRWLNLSIPLADTFLASVLASLIGASRRLKFDLKSMAEQEVLTEKKYDLAKFQSHFLSGFAAWVSETTETIVDLVKSSQKDTNPPDNSSVLYERLYLAASDLNEYLSGITQLSNVDRKVVTKLEITEFNLEEMLYAVLRRFDLKASDNGIQFRCQIDKDASKIRSHQQYVDAILFNLVSNAVKYGNKGSVVVIELSKTKEGFTSISVSDEGPGIPPELQNRVFERFYRINDDRIYKAKGTGVGLYLCRYFAETLGGRIELYSEVGKGSEFRAIIP